PSRLWLKPATAQQQRGQGHPRRQRAPRNEERAMCACFSWCLPRRTRRHSETPYVRLSHAVAAPKVSQAVTTVKSDTLEVTEYISRKKALSDAKLSAVLGVVSAPTDEEHYVPEFDEYVMVISGMVNILNSESGRVTLTAGQSCRLPAGESIKWSWPGPCQYVHIRTPAVTAEYHGRESHKAREVLPGCQKIVATASANGYVKVWDTEVMQELRTLEGHADQVMSVRFTKDGRRLVTASTDRTAKIWALQSGKCLQTLVGHKGPVYSASLSPDTADVELAVTASQDRTAMLWHTEGDTGTCFLMLSGHEKQVHDAEFSPHGRLVATASDDRTARLWEIPSGACMQVLRGHTDAVYCAAFSPDGRSVATASADKTARLWEAATGDCIRTLSGHTSWVRHVAFDEGGTRMVTASGDSTARVWLCSDGQCQLTLTGHTGWMRGAEFSEDGAQIATCARDGTTRIWCATSGCCLRRLEHDAWVRSAAFAPDLLDHDGGTAGAPPRFFERDVAAARNRPRLGSSAARKLSA
ncbi:unnamed protein product, partial [Prorocentrum cordatum]